MKKGIMICTAFALVLAFGGLARAEELTSESDVLEPIGWAVSSSGRVFKVEPSEDVQDVLASAKIECKKATKEHCEGLTTASPEVVVVALHCRRKNDDLRQDESFLGVSLLAEENTALTNAMAKARDRSFNPDQDCDDFYSSAPKEKEEEACKE
ncbi:hypothetical protein HYT05_02075 [Candidatus Kaiserbacteria bacterium]|nr:hypothetical protein [Candidatus Kaiserbacteria bacterium]